MNFIAWLFEPLHRWLTDYMGDAGFILYGGGKNSAPPAPNYAPVASASVETAQIGAQLGREQLAEGKRQYDANMAVTKPVVDAQLEIMRQGIRQGDDYYEYMKEKQRPVEDALNTEAMKAGSDQLQAEAASRAVADVRQGTTASQNQLIRQGLRYGLTPAKIASAGLGTAVNQGLAEASAANMAREKEKTVGFAKKMDVAGLYRGLPGASQGAYGLAVGAGTAANQNNMAPGQAYMGAMGQSNATTMNGRQIAMTGLTSILNSQTSAYNAAASGEGQSTGALIGGAATIGAAFI